MSILFPDGHYVISQDVFNKKSKSMLCVINHGHVVNNIITFANREGKQHKNVYDIVNESIDVYPSNQINIKDSLFYWYRKNHDHILKPLIHKEDLDKGEEFEMFGWVYKILLSCDDDNIYYKVMFK